MPVALKMPEVAESVVEGTISRWLKQEGDRVSKYEPIVEVVTDKVDVEVPSPAAGVLTKIVALEGETVAVGAELALIEEEALVSTATTPNRAMPAAAAAPEVDDAFDGSAPSTAGAAAIDADTPPRWSPLVRRLAEQQNVDLTQVRGTGRGGRVRKRDVLEYIEASSAQPMSTPSPVATPTVEAAEAATPQATGDEAVPVNAVRATIAKRMEASAREVPHAWTTFEVDVTRLVELRDVIKRDFETQEGVKLTFLPFFVKAVVGALKAQPEVNAQWDGDRILLKKEINLGLAVDRPEGLIVPVLRRAEDKSVAALARDLDSLIRKAREHKLAVEDVQGGTFTLNNTGSFGAVLSKPIINQPQAAILATEAIVQRPVVVDGEIAVRSMMHISISFDHRALDGGAVGRFMQTVKANLEGFGPATVVY